MFVLVWQASYRAAYLARVGKGMANTLFFEARPYRNDGKVGPTLIAELEGYVQEGRPVFTDQKYPGPQENFRLLPSVGNSYKLSWRE